jgi:hypothetical protein
MRGSICRDTWRNQHAVLFDEVLTRATVDQRRERDTLDDRVRNDDNGSATGQRILQRIDQHSPQLPKMRICVAPIGQLFRDSARLLGE